MGENSMKFKRYLVSYRHDGGQWNIELPATDIEDARSRLSQLALGRLEGEIIANIPGTLGPLAAFAAFARNLLAPRAA
jgi:ubiquinone biosynthesis protein COQ9